MTVHSSHNNKKKVAIVGSGIAGLSCAYILSNSGKFEVSILEKEETLGMDAHSVDVESADSKIFRFDTPPRAFSPEFYTQLWGLYHHAGIPIEQFDWSYSYSVAGNPEVFFKTGGNKTHAKFLAGYSLPMTLLKPVTRRILRDILKMAWDFRRRLWSASRWEKTKNSCTVRDFLREGNYGKDFVELWFLPMVSMICTCSYDGVMDYPMEFIIDYFMKNGTYNQFRSKFGSQQVVKILTEKVDEIYLGVRVQEICPAKKSHNAKVCFEVRKTESEEIDYKELFFDHVIVACQANTALEIVKDLPESLRDALSSFGYEYSKVLVHEDPNLMPLNREDWSPINFIVAPEIGKAMCSLYLDIPGRDMPLLQTWNPISSADPEKTIKEILFSRPVPTLKTLDGIITLEDSQGIGEIYFSGAYALRSLPLQENGVRSALQISKMLGVECPWNYSLTESARKTGAMMDKFYGLDDGKLSEREALQGPKKSSSESDGKKTFWMDFGLWSPNTKTLADASRDLALSLGKAAGLNENDKVLDVGFGAGDEILVWLDNFGVKYIRGIEPVASQVRICSERLESRRESGKKNDIKLLVGTATEIPFDSNSFTKVVALDCGYHFDKRTDFFSEAFRVLESSGRLTMVDAIFDPSKIPYIFRPIVCLVLSVIFAIPQENFLSVMEVKKQLSSKGFSDVHLTSLTEHIVPGFFKYAQNSRKSIPFSKGWVKLWLISSLIYMLTLLGILDFYLILADKH